MPPLTNTTLPDKSTLLADIQKHRILDRERPAELAIEAVGPGEESVWDFPRPPRVETVAASLRVVFAGQTVAETARGLRVLETAGAPVYYFPPGDVEAATLQPAAGDWTLCEWKGVAVYFDLAIGDQRSARAAFAYPDPLDDLGQGYERLRDYVAFYPSRVDAAFIGDEQIAAQPGAYYAGWVTRALRGPIKGVHGSSHW